MKKNVFLATVLTLALVQTSCSSDDDASSDPIVDQPSEGAVLQPEVGGPNQPNQVYVGLSGETTTTINRGSWDLGFYSGSEFRVVINGAVQMAVKQTATNDITQPVAIDDAVAVGTYDAANMEFVDHPSGAIAQTAISSVSEAAASNMVYLVNLGYEVGTTTPDVGSVNLNGAHRGWKKIRVLRDGNDYKLQYADVNATTYSEVTISKNNEYNFTFFGLTSRAVVSVEPQKEKWDLNFTTFTNEIPTYGSYFYSDCVIINTKGGTRAYEVIQGEGITYDTFTMLQVDDAAFSQDQRAIGSNWRAGGGPNSLPSVRDDRFYVLKDVAGNYYKIQFISMHNTNGERGYPAFQYELLQ